MSGHHRSLQIGSVQLSREPLASPMEADSDRGRAASEHRGDLLTVKPIPPHQGQQFTVTVAELGQSGRNAIKVGSLHLRNFGAK